MADALPPFRSQYSSFVTKQSQLRVAPGVPRCVLDESAPAPGFLSSPSATNVSGEHRLIARLRAGLTHVILSHSALLGPRALSP